MGLRGSENIEKFQIGGSQQHTGKMNWRERLKRGRNLLKEKETW